MKYDAKKDPDFHFMDIDGCIVRPTAITCIFDNGEEVIVCVVGKAMSIRLPYRKAKKIFADWPVKF